MDWDLPELELGLEMEKQECGSDTEPGKAESGEFESGNGEW
jgi:hypothetical protein